ncbi:MAG: hypothetical protein LBE83_08705 [Propionibacteriaceae bacterium]|jgi:N-acetylglucosamine kinase-like BadF-type ATPase|nr:hypothetical protein [Propionibacteriaceae bacterium]
MEVGIDIGGTNTRVLVTDDGVPVSNARVLTASWRHGTLTSDPSNARRLLDLIPEPVVGRLDVPIAVGAHGCDTQNQCQTLQTWISREHPGPVLVVNDSELFGPALGLFSTIAVVCGTGSIVVGRNSAGEIIKVGGFGWILDDPGAAPGVVRAAVIAIMREHDNDAEPGILAHLLMGHYGSTDPVELGYDFTADADITRWGALAPLVFQAAEAGDQLALDIIRTDGGRLAEDVIRLRAKGVRSADVVMAGGVITAQPLLERSFTEALARMDPTLRVHVLRDPPVNGAIALARSLPARGS